jgi:hypothetical protein
VDKKAALEDADQLVAKDNDSLTTKSRFLYTVFYLVIIFLMSFYNDFFFQIYQYTKIQKYHFKDIRGFS